MDLFLRGAIPSVVFLAVNVITTIKMKPESTLPNSLLIAGEAIAIGCLVVCCTWIDRSKQRHGAGVIRCLIYLVFLLAIVITNSQQLLTCDKCNTVAYVDRSFELAECTFLGAVLLYFLTHKLHTSQRYYSYLFNCTSIMYLQ